MNEKQEPELLATFKVYEDGTISLEYKGKTITTKEKRSEVGTAIALLALAILFHNVKGWAEQTLGDLFEEKGDR